MIVSDDGAECASDAILSWAGEISIGRGAANLGRSAPRRLATPALPALARALRWSAHNGPFAP